MARDRTPKLPVNLTSGAFNRNKLAHYRWMLEQAPVCRARLAVIPVYLVAPYAACVSLLRDTRFVRNRTTATGGRRSPFPLPRNVARMAATMITSDGEAHRRQRGLVQKAFSPRSLTRLESRIEALTHELLDAALARGGTVDLLRAYCLPIPVSVIAGILGIGDDEMPAFADNLSALKDGFGPLAIARTLFLEMPRMMKRLEALIERKRAAPGDDILSALIAAEESGERLTHDELVSMAYLLIVAGYETTVHLIANGVVTLLAHREAMERLRAEPALMESAVEEILRYAGPIHGTKPNYATEACEILGVRIPRGAAVLPMLAAANRDPAQFPRPDTFDIERTPNRHLGFGHGPHFCLGAALARMETRIALRTLIERCPGLQLAVAPERLETQNTALWHRYAALPVTLR